MNRLAVSLLGSFQVTLNEDAIARFGVKAARALLAYLVLHAQAPCRREALAGLLWPDQPERTALQNLRQALSWLRKAIGDQMADPPFLNIDRETIQFNPESDYWLDVAAFEELIVTCASHDHRRVETCTPCMRRLQEAVALYRGDFMSGFSLPSASFEDWLVAERERLHRLALDVLRDLAACCEQCGEYEQAMRCARRQIELEPWREEAHRQLMRVLALDGQRGAALAQYEACRRALAEELDVEPAEETTALYEGIRDGAELHVLSFLPPHNLPASLTPFVGREGDLAEIAGHLQDPGCRLLTLVGPGGIGKTRLALEAARGEIVNYDHGVFYVSLAALQSAEAIVPAVAQAFGLAFHGPDDPLRQLTNYLRRKSLLLVLDNFEHLLGGVDVVTEVLRAAPEVKVVVTSRARLNVRAEHLIHVGGLDVPPPSPASANVPGEEDWPTRYARDVLRSSAVQLFLQGACAVRDGAEMAPDELAHVVRICRLVQGMPLAILLAAAWGELLSPAEIAAQVERGIEFLEAEWRGVPERHRSMRAVFNSAWEMLTAAEREAFARLSVLRGGFTAEAAGAVAGVDLRTLRALVHKSFLQRGPDGRYEIHELLRQYAEGRLDEAPVEGENARDLHCAYYAAYLARNEIAIWHRGSPEAALEIDNLRAGWRRAVERRRMGEVRKFVGRLMGGLYVLCDRLGWYREGEAIYAQAVEVLRASEPSRENGIALGVALRAQGCFSGFLGHYDPAARLLEESVSILRALGARQELVLSNNLAAWASVLSGGTGAERRFQESLAMATEIGFRDGICWTLDFLSTFDIRRRAYREAEQREHQVLQIARETGNRVLAAWGNSNLAHIAHARGEYVEARQFYEEAIAVFQEVGQRQHLGHHLNALGDVVLALGEGEEARAYCQAALSRAQDMGEDYGIADALANLGNVVLAMGDVAGAERRYRQALEMAIARGEARLSVRVLVALATWRAHRGEREEAVELLALALCQRTFFGWVEYAADRLLDELRAQLSPIVFAAASERGRARDLETTMRELLAELEDVQRAV
jgi:DNA-binding SARP family transcriptional activator/Tfp pilus assembly protein PilF